MTIRTIPASPQGLAAIQAINQQLRLRGDGFEASVEERRAAMLAFAAAQPEVGGVAETEEQLGGHRSLRIAPSRSSGHVLYLHGGAFVLGSPDTHRGLAARYALASGLTLHLLDYPLAPERPYPAAVESALAAAEALAAVDPDYALLGDSAGGGLALALLIALRDRGGPLPRMAALSSPWLDLALSGSSIDALADKDAMLSRRGLAQDALRYRGHVPPADLLVSPLFGRVAGLPPLFVQVGGAEMLRDDSIRLHARVIAAGGRIDLELWEGMTHAWTAFGALLPEAAAAITSLAAALRVRVADPA